jgi:hypothetical protein
VDDEKLDRLRMMTSDMDTMTAFRNLIQAVVETAGGVRRGDWQTGTAPVDQTRGALVCHYCLAVSYLRLWRGWRLRALLSAMDPTGAARRADALDRRIHDGRLTAA